MEYLIVKCKELEDPYECDASRTPVCLCKDYTPYKTWGYEVYEVDALGNFKLIQNYDEEIDEHYYVVIYDGDDCENIVSVERLGTELSDNEISTLKRKYKIPGKFKDIKSDLLIDALSGFFNDKKQWVAIGKKCQDRYYWGY